jgi:type 1 fimbriae regulatory protein FimE
MEHLTKIELEAILAVAKEHSERDWLAILVAYNHGLRISEVINLTPANFKDGHITVQRLKGSMRTTQPLVDNERAAIEAWIQPFRANQRVFTIQRSMLSKLFAKYARLARIPAHLRHFHVLKHSIAMHSIKAVNIASLQKYLGHTSLKSTGIYLNVDDKQASADVQNALYPQEKL